MIPLMEAVAVEVQNAGGFVQMILYSDRVARAQYTVVPEKYLVQEPRYLAEWVKNTTVQIVIHMSSGDTREMVRFFQMLRFDNGMLRANLE